MPVDGSAGAERWLGSPFAAVALFVAAWALVFVAFAAQLHYTNIVSWTDALARSAVDRGPWAIVSPGIVALAWLVHARKPGALGLVLLHSAGLLASLLFTEALVQELFLPALFPDRPAQTQPAWRPIERWRGGEVPPPDAPPRHDFIPDKSPARPPPPVPDAAPDGMVEPFGKAGPEYGMRPPRPGGAPPEPTPGSAAPSSPWLVFVTVAMRKAYNGVPLYLLIAALAHAYFFWRNLRERERRLTDLEARLLVARADMLRLQLEPHFLFNTLNAIGTVVYRDAALADDLIGRLSTLLRRMLDLRDERTISLEAEMETLRAYVAIEQARFGDRLLYEEAISPEARGFPVPVMLLQPLAENAVRHGIEPLGRTGTLRVMAQVRDDELQVGIEDDGVGMGAGAASPRGFGLGLNSATDRLQAMYGSRARIATAARSGGGTRIEIHLPRTPLASAASITVSEQGQ